MADEQKGEIQIHDDVGKGGEMGDSVCDGLSLTVRGHNRRIHDCPLSCPWGDNELNP